VTSLKRQFMISLHPQTVRADGLIDFTTLRMPETDNNKIHSSRKRIS
jgi:hypothetical protein